MGSDETAVARAAAQAASAALLEIRERLTAGELDAAAARTLGDRTAHDVIVAALRAAYPDDAVLSEEAADDLSRLGSRRVWIVDPLDGTREFAEPGRDDWAVHVAFWHAGELQGAAVALPALGEIHTTDVPAPLRPAAQPPRVLVSRTRPPAEAGAVVRALHAELVPMGSAGAKILAVVRGAAEVYVHAGGQFEWDSAAPVAVARAAGLHASRIDGTPLRYNEPDPSLPDLVVCRPELADAVLAALAEDDGRAPS